MQQNCELRVYTFQLEGMPLGPSANLRGDRASGWRNREMKRQARAHMEKVAEATGPPTGEPVELAKLEITFHMPTLAVQDLDNLRARCKEYVDVLVERGYVADDRWTVIPDQHERAVLDRHNPRFEIKLTELPFDTTLRPAYRRRTSSVGNRRAEGKKESQGAERNARERGNTGRRTGKRRMETEAGTAAEGMTQGRMF